MRLSAEPSSPFYNEALVRSVDVFVDGYTVPPCVEASEEEGWVDCLVADDAGRIVENETRDRAKIERRFGRVVIHRNQRAGI